jgi:uncharacterized protein YkwD
MLSRSLTGGLLAGWLMLQAPLWMIGFESQAADAPQRGPDFARVKELILEHTNDFRRKEGRPVLKVNADLATAAQEFADFMARTDKYSHTADGQQPWERTAKAGYKECIVAENIAYVYNSAGFTTEELARQFFEGWKNSPEHRKNMLDPDLFEIGVGVAHSDTSGKYYGVQDFGRPKSHALVFKLTNDTDATVEYKLDDKTFSIEPHYTVTHTRCRPPQLQLQRSDEEKSASSKQSETLRPGNGDQLVIRKAKNGQLAIQKL